MGIRKDSLVPGAAAQIALIGLLTIVMIAAPIGAIARVRRRGDRSRWSCRDFAAIACAINVAALLTLVYYLWRTDVFQWYYGLPRPVVVMTYLPWAGAAITMIAMILTIRQITRPSWSWPSKCTHLLTLIALLIFPIFCWYWNLLA